MSFAQLTEKAYEKNHTEENKRAFNFAYILIMCLKCHLIFLIKKSIDGEQAQLDQLNQ